MSTDEQPEPSILVERNADDEVVTLTRRELKRLIGHEWATAKRHFRTWRDRERAKQHAAVSGQIQQIAALLDRALERTRGQDE